MFIKIVQYFFATTCIKFSFISPFHNYAVFLSQLKCDAFSKYVSQIIKIVSHITATNCLQAYM